MSAVAAVSSVTKQSVLRLYKDLLRYSGKLQFTDKNYYVNRIRKEFRVNQTLDNTDDIDFNYNKGIAFLARERLV